MGFIGLYGIVQVLGKYMIIGYLDLQGNWDFTVYCLRFKPRMPLGAAYDGSMVFSLSAVLIQSV